MFEIKMSQGTKAGKSGILPKEKVTKKIAEIRGSNLWALNRQSWCVFQR